MEAKFKQGDKVKCINAENTGNLITGKVYLVADCLVGEDSYIQLVGDYRNLSGDRFELVERQIKFKPGDFVLVVRKFDKNVDSHEGFENSWVCSMDRFIGKCYIVSSITNTGIALTDHGDTYRFPPCVLQLQAVKDSNVQKIDDLEFQIRSLKKENAYLLSIISNS